MDEREFTSLRKKLMDQAKGLSDGIELMEKRYHRRGRKRPIDVNLPAGVGQARPKPFGGSQTPSPYKQPLREAFDKATAEAEVKILRQEKTMTVFQRREAIKTQYDAKRRGETILTIPGTAITAAVGWVTGKVGLTEDATKASKSTKKVPLPKQSPQNIGRIEPILSLVVMRIELDRYPPFAKVSEAIWNLQNEARDREYRKGRGYGYPTYLMPDLLLEELGIEAFYPPLAIVPEDNAKEFLAEVSRHSAISKLTSGMLLLLEKWTKEILRYPRTSGPEGGGSIRA